MTATTQDISAALTANSEWLKRLATALVGRSDADDVVQDTMEAALRRPPALDRPVRPWLRTVLTNVVRMRARGRSRRGEREQRAQHRSATPAATAEDSVAKLQSQRTLVDAVMTLPKTYRETIVGRYVDGLSAAEIARRDGLSAATVRSRHQRALVMLREQLDRRSDGDREHWRAALLPLLAVPRQPAAAATAAGANTGLWLAAGAMVVAAAVAVAVVSSSSSDSGGDAPEPPTAGVAAVAPQPTDEASHRPPTRAPDIRRFGGADERAAFAAALDKARRGAERPKKTYDFAGDRVTTDSAREVPTLPPGSLDKKYIKNQIRGAIPLLAECHDLAVTANPDSEADGTMVIDFVVDAEQEVGGYVREAAVTEDSPLRNAALSECVVETILSLEFPPPEGGGEVRVRYPMTFAAD